MTSATRRLTTVPRYTAGSLALSESVKAGLCALLGRPGQSRGIKVRNRAIRERGWLSLVSGTPPAIITEPAFGSNAADATLLREKQFLIGREIVRRCKRYFDDTVGV